MGFFEAMKFAAGHLFLKNALKSKKDKKPILIVEDGGYLAPQINRICLEKRTLKEVLELFGLIDNETLMSKTDTRDHENQQRFSSEKKRVSVYDAGIEMPDQNELSQPIDQWLSDILIGSVEHTRNGYDNVLEVQEDFGMLAFPACSIAISDLKRTMEAKECAISILHAIESILQASGYTLSNRRALVLGSRGAIGGNLMEILSSRAGQKNVAGVDIVVENKKSTGNWLEAKKLEEIPKDFLYDTDLFVGVVGRSILKKDLIEDLILNSKREKWQIVTVNSLR